METSPPRPSGAPWAIPPWLHARLIPDARFARAYDAVGDSRRALLKGLIADHFALNPPAPARGTDCAQLLASGLALRSVAAPRPFALLLADASLDAPALLLAALMPALSSRVAEVLVLRLGSRASLPDSLLTACELAGQERVAAVSPALAGRLLFECAASGQPGLVLYPDTPELRRIMQRPALRAQLDASCLRLVPLGPPRSLGLWRDAPGQFDPEVLAFLFAGQVFASGGAQPGRRSTAKAVGPGDAAFSAFAAAPRDLLLVPDARLGTGQPDARLVVGESRSGLWTWPELSPELFVRTAQTFTSASSSAAASAPFL